MRRELKPFLGRLFFSAALPPGVMHVFIKMAFRAENGKQNDKTIA